MEGTSLPKEFCDCDNDGRFWVLGHEMRESEKTEIELVNIEDFHFLPEMPGWSGQTIFF